MQKMSKNCNNNNTKCDRTHVERVQNTSRAFARTSFVSSIRHLHAKNVIKLIGLEDQWMARRNASNNAVSRVAFTDASKQMTDLFNKFVTGHSLAGTLNKHQTYTWLNTLLKQWKKSYHNRRVKHGKDSFSRQTVKCLIDELELRRLGNQKLETLKYFFIDHLCAQND